MVNRLFASAFVAAAARPSADVPARASTSKSEAALSKTLLSKATNESSRHRRDVFVVAFVLRLSLL
jgi:hypothetical protein